MCPLAKMARRCSKGAVKVWLRHAAQCCASLLSCKAHAVPNGDVPGTSCVPICAASLLYDCGKSGHQVMAQRRPELFFSIKLLGCLCRPVFELPAAAKEPVNFGNVSQPNFAVNAACFLGISWTKLLFYQAPPPLSYIHPDPVHSPGCLWD